MGKLVAKFAAGYDSDIRSLRKMGFRPRLWKSPYPAPLTTGLVDLSQATAAEVPQCINGAHLGTAVCTLRRVSMYQPSLHSMTLPPEPSEW